MKVILQREVEKLGAPGDVVDVADGYARNYLIPRKLAAPASEGAVKHAQQLRRGHDEQVRKALAALSVPLAVAAAISNPRITTVDNREAKILVGQKIPLIVQDVAGNPLSQLQTIGIQLRVTPHLTQDKRVIMDLHPEVSATVTVEVVRE